jgi:hypothetical protein
MSSSLKKNREKRTDDKEENDLQLEKGLDNYTSKLVKVVGVFGVILGAAILVAFWYWVIKMLFKVGE